MKSGLMGLWIGLVLGLGLGAGGTFVWVTAECRATWTRLFDLPIGEFAVVPDPPAVVQKTALRVLSYRPLPTSEEVRTTNLFAQPPTGTPPAESKEPSHADPPVAHIPGRPARRHHR